MVIISYRERRHTFWLIVMFNIRSVASLKKKKKYHCEKTKHEKENGEWPEKEKYIAKYIYSFYILEKTLHEWMYWR